jgi:uncharacterized protein involved in exopolysaccharide biosynthesis
VSSSRPPQAPAAVEWDVPPAPSGTRRTSRNPVGRALSSTLAAMLALFLLAVGASAYYAFTMSEQYTGRSLVQFRPRTTVNGGVVSNETTASSAASYGAYLGIPSTVRTVAGQIAVPSTDLRDNMSVQLIPATTSLSITFEDVNPVVAARGASALAQVVAERATDDPLVSATVLAPASVPDLPSTPSKTIVLGAGGVLGLLLAGVAYVVLNGRRRAQPDTAPQPQPQPVAQAAPAERVEPAEQAPAARAPAAGDGPADDAGTATQVAGGPTEPALTSR